MGELISGNKFQPARKYMNGIFIIAFFLIGMPMSSRADYVSDLQAGNMAYKSRQWAKAADSYSKAYSIKPSPALKKFMDASKSAAYRQYIATANASYKTGAKEEALRNYKAAYSFYPGKKLQSVINRLQGTPADDPVIVEKPGDGNQVFKWVLIGSDAALLIGTIASAVAVSSGEAEYNTLYDQLDNTDLEAYNQLVAKKASVEGTQTMFGALAVITGIALAYTALDLFVFHQAFPADVALKAENKGTHLALVVDVKF